MIDEKLRMRGRRTQVNPGTAVLNIASWSPESIDPLPPATPQGITITVRPGQIGNRGIVDPIVAFRSILYFVIFNNKLGVPFKNDNR